MVMNQTTAADRCGSRAVQLSPVTEQKEQQEVWMKEWADVWMTVLVRQM